MKRLVAGYAMHFVKWLLENAVFVGVLDVELKPQHLFADALLEVKAEGRRALLHIEFQTYRDPEMETRVMEYNMLASRQYGHCPVTSYVIYLRKDGEVAQSPCIRPGANREEVFRFHYQVIKLWEVPAEVLLQMGWAGLLPLVTLTKGGKQPEVVKEMIETLASAGEMDLLALARLIGGLAFKKQEEREWFRRRFSMFQDILRESWVYQEIGQEFLAEGLEKGLERGLERGLKKGREEGKLEGQRQVLMSYVQMRFAELSELTKQQLEGIKDSEVLEAVTLKLFAAQTVEEAKKILFEVGKH